MKNATIGLIIGVVLVGGLTLYFLTDSQPGSDSFLRKAFVASTFQKEEPKQNAVNGDEPPNTEIHVSTEFRDWVKNSSESLHESVESQEQTEALLRTKSSALSLQESQYLAQMALQASAPANTRIFSVYLLGLQAPHNLLAISAVLEAPLSFQEKPATHSPEETLAMQEKSLRRMAIEDLLKSFQKGELPREQIVQTFDKIPDAQLKKYAHTRLQELTK